MELPLRSTTNQPKPGPSNCIDEIEKPVIDLCSSPKKYSTVQSRLSKFFTKSNNCNGEENNELQRKDPCIKPADKETYNYLNEKNNATTTDSINVNDLSISSS